jgi:calcium/calmodulin-dependent protein kinase I
MKSHCTRDYKMRLCDCDVNVTRFGKFNSANNDSIVDDRNNKMSTLEDTKEPIHITIENSKKVTMEVCDEHNNEMNCSEQERPNAKLDSTSTTSTTTIAAAAAAKTHPGWTLSHLPQLFSSLQQPSTSSGVDKSTTTSTATTTTTTTTCTTWDFKFEDHYEKQEALRSGSYGRVYKCRHVQDIVVPVSKYAVKEMNRTKMKAKDIATVIREVSILHELSQPSSAALSTVPSSDESNATTTAAVATTTTATTNFIQLIDFFVHVDTVYVVQIYAAGGDVFDRLVQRKHYTERDVRTLAKGLLQAVYTMHTNTTSCIVHRDLKPENLLLLDEVSDTHVVVADFGFARHVDDTDGCCTTRCGTPSYVSPELLLGYRYNGSVDIWSVGCIIYMLLAGYPPFNAQDHRALFRSIRAGDFVFHDEHWTNVSIHAKQLITHLLCVNVKKRWTAKEALDCPWFTSMTDAQLQERDLSNTIDQLKKFDPVNAWKKAFNALGFCATASFWQPDVMSFQQQLDQWDVSTGSVSHSSDRPQQHRISFTDLYILTREIRKGKSGTVWECQHKSSGATYAVKVIPRTSKPVDDEFVLNEVSIMQSLAGSPYVVQLLDFYEETESFYLVMEYCQGGDLFDRVLRFTHYTESDAKDLTVILLKAIRSMHKSGIAHRDIKPQNVLLMSNDDNVRIRIADFGYARRVHMAESLSNRVGTPSYVAPEILKNLPHDERVDLWSLGVVVFVLLVGYPPFLENDQATLFHKIRKGEWVFYDEDWKPVSQEAKDFVQGLLVVDPNERWTIDECLRSSWIQQNPNQVSSVDLSVVLSNLRLKKHSLRNLARSVIAFSDGIRPISDDSAASMH